MSPRFGTSSSPSICTGAATSSSRNHPKAGALTFPGRLWQSSAHGWRSGRAPQLGEHNTAVLHEELGYELEDLVRLRELDAI